MTAQSSTSSIKPIPPIMTDDRLNQIGPLAAKLCYAANCPADNICIGYCAAVVPEGKYLEAAASQIFDQYWKAHREYCTR